jgi:hypothetical protein
VDLSNKFLLFQISKVKGRQKAPVMHAVLEFMNGVLSNPDEAAECYIDEAWSILKDPMAAEFAETMWRSARARNCGMCAISQQPIEFFGSDQGKVILALSATHMIFRHDQRQPAQATASYYDLSEEETSGLLNLQAGEGYLVVGHGKCAARTRDQDLPAELFPHDDVSLLSQDPVQRHRLRHRLDPVFGKDHDPRPAPFIKFDELPADCVGFGQVSGDPRVIRSDPLEEQDASYLAASARISSFFNSSMSPTHTLVHTTF